MKVAVVYHQFPHYRAPIIRTLAKSERYQYVFYASTEDFYGIKAFKGDDIVAIHPLTTRATKRGFKVQGYFSLLCDPSLDAFIVLGNPNIIATWMLAVFGRLSGRKVLFWAHGWIKSETWAKNLVRNFYFRLSNMVLVYGERSKSIGESLGYPSQRIRVIYNSLDFEKTEAVYHQLARDTSNKKPQHIFPQSDRPLVICSARLTELCRFDLLIEAGSLLKKRGCSINIILVGDGPARNSLESQAAELAVDVFFYGSCYDETTLGWLIFNSDATVSPGKIGLTAIHSLSYGTPAFTHGDMDHQMPEAEAILPNVTGDFFRNGDANDLADCLQHWFDTNKDRATVRRACRDVIARKWNPLNQRLLIEEAISTCFQENY